MMSGTSGASFALPYGVRLNNGRYRIEKTLGQGGFAVTYLAHDTVLNRLVAVKELLPDGCYRDPQTYTVQPQRLTPDEFHHIRQRLIEEAQLLASLRHPNIVQIYDVFEQHGTGYFVMEYLHGRTLAQLLQARGGVMPDLCWWGRYWVGQADWICSATAQKNLARAAGVGAVGSKISVGGDTPIERDGAACMGRVAGRVGARYACRRGD
ncbi:MAG: protein kinase domain-containing protein [Fimbriimonadales bacterium]